MKNVVIVGQGYVGLPLAIAAAENGHNVIGFDLDRSLVDSLNSGVSHVEDILDSSIKKLLVTQKYRATFNPSDIEDCDVAIIAVPTPLNATREPDLSFLLSACSILGKYLGMSSLIINESTSYPGTLRNIIVKITFLRLGYKKQSGANLFCKDKNYLQIYYCLIKI